jgi:hypothetical protein
MAYVTGHRQVSLVSGVHVQGPITCDVVCHRSDTRAVISNVTRSMSVASLLSLHCTAQILALRKADPLCQESYHMSMNTIEKGKYGEAFDRISVSAT